MTNIKVGDWISSTMDFYKQGYDTIKPYRVYAIDQRTQAARVIGNHHAIHVNNAIHVQAPTSPLYHFQLGEKVIVRYGELIDPTDSYMMDTWGGTGVIVNVHSNGYGYDVKMDNVSGATGYFVWHDLEPIDLPNRGEWVPSEKLITHIPVSDGSNGQAVTVLSNRGGMGIGVGKYNTGDYTQRWFNNEDSVQAVDDLITALEFHKKRIQDGYYKK